MKIVSKMLLLVLFACIIVILNKYGPGHVIIFVSKYRLDLALSGLILIIIITFVITYYLIRFIANINNMPDRLKQWRLRHRLLQSRKLLNIAGINYFEGKYFNSYKNAMNSIDKETNKDNQFMALMLAYKSSNFIGDYKKEEEILSRLENYSDKKWQLAKYITNAENHYSKKMYAKCLDGLNKAITLDKKHVRARQIRLETYIHLHNYDKAFDELKWLIKNNCLDHLKAMSYKLEIYRNLFEILSDEAELDHFYRKFDKDDQDNLIINKFYLNALIRLKLYDHVITLLEKWSIDNHNVSDVILKLAKIIQDRKDVERLLKLVTQISSEKAGDYTLLLILGICNFKLKNYLNARKNLEDSLSIKVTLDGLIYLLFTAIETKDTVLHQLVEAKLAIFNKDLRL
ncbi:MAG: heme biosynthesis HemY N-terminal domain-containing protein [Neisseriaceae bacterium]